MAGVVSNLVYRVSVSAIVGAIVAGGLIYLNNDRVIKNYRAEQATQSENQAIANTALIDANENIASAIAALDAQYEQRFAEFSETMRAMNIKIDATPAAEVADYSEITSAIAALNDILIARIEVIEAKLSAVLEQN